MSSVGSTRNERLGRADPAEMKALQHLRLHCPDRHGDGGLGGVDHRHAERLLERAAVARAMPAQPMTITSAPSCSTRSRPIASMRASVPSPDAVSATLMSTAR